MKSKRWAWTAAQAPEYFARKFYFAATKNHGAGCKTCAMFIGLRRTCADLFFLCRFKAHEKDLGLFLIVVFEGNNH